MKELLNSFLTSTRSNVNAQRSITKDRAHFLPTGFIAGVLLVCGFVVLSMTNANAQSSAPVSAPITTDAYSHDQWKSRDQYISTIQTEQSETQQYLQTPNLPPAELALYLGYSYLLTYIKTDLDAKLPLDNLAYVNFKRVTQEASINPQLFNMSIPAFQEKYNALVIKLHQ